MKAVIAIVLLFVVIGVERPRPALAQGPEPEPVLETYSVAHGGDGGAAGLTAVLLDKNLGNGTAEARIVFSPTATGNQLALKVTRRVRRGEITFALLVFRVEIRAYDAQDAPVYSRDLDGFTFGDSSSGRWFEKLKDLPADIARLTISFVGNYE